MPEETSPSWRCRGCGAANAAAAFMPFCVSCGAPRVPPRPATRGGPLPRAARVLSPAGGEWSRRLAAAACWSVLLATAGLLGLVRVAGDRWWPTVLFLYGPRWVCVLPAAALVPTALVWRRKALALPLAGAALLSGPLLGFNTPWPARLPAGASDRPGLRVLTCNVQSGQVDVDALLGVIAAAAPDVVLLQECHGLDRIKDLFPEPQWNLRVRNDLALASRFPVDASELRLMREPWSGGRIARYTLGTPFGPLQVFGVHLETPRKGLEPLLEDGAAGVAGARENLAQRWDESAAASRWVGESRGPVLVAGDFNMPVDSSVYRAHWSGYANAFSDAGFGFGYTKRTRWFGIRIDHVLSGRGLSCRRSWVVRDVGSDHRPLLADLVWDRPRG